MENYLDGLTSPFDLGLSPCLWILALLQTSTHHMLKMVMTDTLIQNHHSNQAMKLTWIHRECIVRSTSSPIVKVFKLKRFIFRCIDIQINFQTSIFFFLLCFFVRLRKLFFLFKDESRASDPIVKSKSIMCKLLASSNNLSTKPINWFFLLKDVGMLFWINYSLLNKFSLSKWCASTSASIISMSIRVVSAFTSKF